MKYHCQCVDPLVWLFLYICITIWLALGPVSSAFISHHSHPTHPPTPTPSWQHALTADINWLFVCLDSMAHSWCQTILSVCVCWAFSELFIGQMILLVVCTCVIVPSVAFPHTVLWMPFLSASRVSSIGFTRTHRQTGHATHSFALSQALCVKQVDLCLLFLSADFFLFLSFYICHHLSHTQHTLSSKRVPTHMQIDCLFFWYLTRLFMHCHAYRWRI